MNSDLIRTLKPSLEHIHLDDFPLVDGFSLSNVHAGERGDILTRGVLTSDDPNFYLLMDAITSIVFGRTGHLADSLYQFLIVIHADQSADVYINELPMSISVVAKNPIAAGQLVAQSDIADVRRLQFLGLEFADSDKVICLIKVGWKFGLFLDLYRPSAPDGGLDIPQMEADLGALYRYLAFEHVYKSFSSKEQFEAMQNDGWFPFIELVGSEFITLARIYENEFDVEKRVNSLLDRFDSARIAKITDKWWSNPTFEQKRPFLQAAIGAYLQGDAPGYILCLKTLLTEIEGLLRLLFLAEEGRPNTTIPEMLDFLTKKAKIHAGESGSLFLPEEFIQYLRDVLFRSFNLATGDVVLSRHSTGHGVAAPDQYTRARAFQAILALDQIFFYL